MTEMALSILKKSPTGYFLLVEAGRIDHAHHSNRGRQQADETVEFSRAVDIAKLMTDEDDTMIVVSADHSHVMTYAGYPVRRNPVTGIGGRGSDGLPYETLSYGNGPSYSQTFVNGERRNITNDNFTARRRSHQATVPMSSETHSGEDVSVYANGPWAHMLSGSFEQSVIPLVMAHASGIGPFKIKFPIAPHE